MFANCKRLRRPVRVGRSTSPEFELLVTNYYVQPHYPTTIFVYVLVQSKRLSETASIRKGSRENDGRSLTVQTNYVPV